MNTSMRMRTEPPQHWPRSGPSDIRDRSTGGATQPTVPFASAARARSIACHSSVPPPMVPANEPSCSTTMRAPASRGAEPLASTMLTRAQRRSPRSALPMVAQVSMPPPYSSRMERIARMIASGVAGASSAGTRPGLRLAMALEIAENTDIANMSGGSPTAFER